MWSGETSTYVDKMYLYIHLFKSPNVLGLLEGGLGVGLAVALGRQLLHLQNQQADMEGSARKHDRALHLQI
jgi:hypothetical protein